MPLIHGFELLRDETLSELNSRALLYRHARTGARLLSLINDDENKVFGITFRTPPADSTGVAHIMEHSVLCGSRKYPVKEPFVELMKGSLNTFLNAMTFPDKTCYPVASQNVQDFYNLIDVYLDAVFYPTIGPHTLDQEGWHFDLDDPNGEIQFKGVVYNEMKGAYSSPEGVLAESVQHALFPDNTYGLDSGGDPEHIPDLTYAAFKDFHSRYYHPSNAYIFFSGDDDPTRRLEILDGYLRDYDRIEIDSSVVWQEPFRVPVTRKVPYEVSQEGGETRAFVSVGWALPEGAHPELVLGLVILEHILAGTPAAPLYKALIDSGLGEDLTGAGLDTGMRQMVYTIGLKGVQAENTGRVETLILETMARLARDGIDPATVAASMNTVEFQLREKNTGSYPRGLVMMINALTAWIYDRDPLDALRLEAPLAAIKARLAKGERVFEDLLTRHLVENTHRATVILEPDAGLAERRAAAERERLRAAQAAMSPEDLRRVVNTTLELRRRQETPDSPEALATIPALQLSDLDRAVRTIPARAGASEEIYVHDLFTNGILYLDLGFNLHVLPPELLPYLPLFSRALLETGAGAQNFVALMQRIGTNTGGIHPQTFLSAAPGRKQAEAWLFLRSKAMVPQAGELLAILTDVLNSAHLDDRERFRQMLLEEKASLEAGMVRAGHRVVNGRLKSRLDEAGWAADQTGGVGQLFFLRELAGQVDQDWPRVQAALESIRARLLVRGALVCNVTLDDASYGKVEPRLVEFIQGLPGGAAAVQDWPAPGGPEAEGLTIPSQVNFVGKAVNLYDHGYRLHGSSLAIVNYLNSTWMWEQVRVKGGAYGGFAAFDQYSGVASFLSYRDPNLADTLAVYDQTAGFLKGLELVEAERVKAIIGGVGELDAYQLPDAKGYTSLLRKLLGVDDARRQKFRDELLETTTADFKRLGEALEGLAGSGKVAVLGSAGAIQAAAEARPGWMEITQVL